MVVDGSLVWVQRKNGTWWPGRVVPRAEFSPLAATHHHIAASSPPPPPPSSSTSPSNSKTPIMLLGKENHSVDWYNLEKSKRIKAFRCGEFDDCIKQVESSQASAYAEDMKYSRRKDAILHALSLERKEQQKKLKRAAGEVQARKVFRSTRSRCTYLPIQTESSKVSTSRVESDDSTSANTELRSSQNDLRVSDRGRVVQPSGSLPRQLRSMKIKKQDKLANSLKSPECKSGEVGIQKEMRKGIFSISNLRGSSSTDGKMFVLKNSTRRTTNQLAVDASSQDIGCASETKSGENVYWEASQAALGDSNLKDSDANSFDSACDQQNGMDMMLIDVDLTVQQSSGGELVPFICLVSRTSQKAIIGYPINIEVLQDSSEIFLLTKNSLLKRLFEDGRDRINQLAWKTSRRTPVCYISNSQNCPTPENGKSPPTIQSFSASVAKGNRFSLARESSGKSMKKQTSSNDKTSAHAIKNKGLGRDSLRLTCVPVNHVFSKLFSTLGKF